MQGWAVLFLTLNAVIVCNTVLQTCIEECVTNSSITTKTACNAASVMTSCARQNECYSREVDTICRQVSQLGLCIGHTLTCSAAPAERACIESTAACATRRSVGTASPCSIARIQQECALENGCYNQQYEYICNTFTDFGCDLTCPVSCADVRWPANGKRTGENYVVDSVIRFQCDTGMTLVGAAEIRCGGSGNWSNPLPTCVAGSPCSVPTSSELGNRVRVVGTPRSSYRLGDTISFSCVEPEEYELKGSGATVCLATGLWSQAVPECRKIDGPGSNWWIALCIAPFLICVVFPCALHVMKTMKEEKKGAADYSNVSGSPARSLAASPMSDPRQSHEGVLDPMHQTTWMSLHHPPDNNQYPQIEFNRMQQALPPPTTTAPMVAVPPVSPTAGYYHT